LGPMPLSSIDAINVHPDATVRVVVRPFDRA
jgi:hypothetical protein